MAIPSISASALAATPANSVGMKQTNSPVQEGKLAQEKILGVRLAEQAVASEPAGGASQPDQQQIEQAVAKLRDALPDVARNLQFSVDNDTGKTVVKIVDSTTNEVIRQFPSEELLALAKAMDKTISLLGKQEA